MPLFLLLVLSFVYVSYSFAMLSLSISLLSYVAFQVYAFFYIPFVLYFLPLLCFELLQNVSVNDTLCLRVNCPSPLLRYFGFRKYKYVTECAACGSTTTMRRANRLARKVRVDIQ